MKKNNLIIILLIAFNINCSKKGEDKISDLSNSFDISSFSDKRNLSGKKLDLGLVFSPVSIFYQDSLLFISSINQDFNMPVFNSKENFKKLGEIISYGSGPDEMLSAADIDFVGPKEFWAHDVVSSNMKKFNLNILIDSISVNMNDFVIFGGPILSVSYLNNDRFFTTTQDINPPSRFYAYDLNGNRLNQYASSYPDYGQDLPITVKVDVFWAWPTVHPNREKFLIAYEYLDLLEIYDKDLRLQKRIHGPHQFLPDFDIKERGGYPYMQRIYERTKYAYVSLCSNENMIFLLYGEGKTRSKEEGEAAIHYNHIVSIDWEGKPLGYYELDHGVTSIAVDWKERVIFGLDRIESEVYAFKF